MLDRALLSHSDRSEFADSTKVVSHEIHNHVEFSGVLGARAKFLWVLPSGARALHRARRDAARSAVDRQEELGTERKQRGVRVQFQKCAVARRGRCESVQCQSAGGARDSRAEVASDVGLKNVAGKNQFAGAFHHALERCPTRSAVSVECAAHFEARRPHDCGCVNPVVRTLPVWLANIEPTLGCVAVDGGARNSAENRIGPELSR